MKKIIVLLLVAFCSFVSCQKEGGSSLDGTTWKLQGEIVVLNDGYASSYFKENFVDTQSYSIKGNKIFFKSYLQTYGNYDPEVDEYYYDVEGHFNEDKSKMFLSIGKLDEDGSLYDIEEFSFIRVIQ